MQSIIKYSCFYFFIIQQEDSVKLQVLNLGVKLYLTNPQQTSLLCQYVFTLARYDPNYDVRDRARFLHQFIFPASGKETVLSKNARQIFLSSKPAPALESKYKGRENYQLGSLSHYINMRAAGYNDLPEFPAVAPDSSVRNIEGFMHETAARINTNNAMENSKANKNSQKKNASKKEKNFLSESEDKSSEYSNSSSSSSSGSDSSSDNSSSSDEEEEKQASTETAAIKNVNVKIKTAAAGNDNNLIKNNNEVKLNGGTSDSESSSSYGDSSSSSSSSSEQDSDSEPTDNEKAQSNKQSNQKDKNIATNSGKPAAEKNNLDLLLDLDDIPPIGPVMTPSLGGFLTPGNYLILIKVSYYP